MKCSESWLREWVNPKLNRKEISDELTMSGLEVEEIIPASSGFSNVVVGEIKDCEKHPKMESIFLCQVDIGKQSLLKIVCGAPNVKIGLKTAVALADAELPHHKKVSVSKIHDVISEGMLCSGAELGLTEESDIIFELPPDALPGTDLKEYLKLEDYIIDIAITPNRGDCLSIKGIARELSAITNTPFTPITLSNDLFAVDNKLEVNIDYAEGCPRYIGRIIKNVSVAVKSPAWLTERLRRSGQRSINPVVDVTNYVMIEMGQPMHAFDLATIEKKIVIRKSKQNENIALLDGTSKTLDDHTLIIADQSKPLAIAGVMGGLDSSVTLLTQDIFLESAFFSPLVVAKSRQHYGLNSESSYRFERGVDPVIQREAIIRATQLILEIAGGEAGPITEAVKQDYLPKTNQIRLSKNKVDKVLGLSIPENEIENILTRLGFKLKKTTTQDWEVEAPSYRFDIKVAEDVIEEIARLYGYNKIPTHALCSNLNVTQPESALDLAPIRQKLSNLGYHEIISYSFIDKKKQQLIDPDYNVYELINPITAEMTVMRTNLWPGLIDTFLYNKSRQQSRIRLFEIGLCFPVINDLLEQELILGGLISGTAEKEQWGAQERRVDFYDLKGNVDDVLAAFYNIESLIYKPASHPALHPNQSASVYVGDTEVAVMGKLHPSLVETLNLSTDILLFEVYLSEIRNQKKIYIKEVSKFPEIRRDIAILVNRTIPAKEIQDTIKEIAGNWLKEIFIFDVYQGKGIATDLKSVALALILQHPTRTLIDQEVAELMESVMTALKGKFKAELRSEYDANKSGSC